MKFNPDIHHRHSIRLRGYDYSQAGAYFITICTHERQPLFGVVQEGNMVLNEFGQLVAKTWAGLANQYDWISLGEFVVMPNHFHGLLLIEAPAGLSKTEFPRKPLGRLLGAFKMITAKQVNLMRGLAGVPLWQRNYFEHIVRDEAAYLKIVEYIRTNPKKWSEDRYHIT